MNIVITGASKGIGLAIAKRFALEREEHRFALCARGSDTLANMTSRLRAKYPAHAFEPLVCDISVAEDVRRFASFCSEKLGTIDLLVHNAGFGIFKPVTELSAAEFRSVLNTDFTGALMLTRELLPAMRARKSGTIVAIDSLAGKHGFAGGAAYCASKYALRGFMQCLFLEVRNDNIRCVTIFPGSVDTAFHTGMTTIPASRMLRSSDVAETVWLAARLPLGATISELDIRPTNPKG